MSARTFRWAVAVVFVAFSLACPGRAEDAFYRVPIKDLKLTEGKLPEMKVAPEWPRTSDFMEPTLRLDRDVEGYIGFAYTTFSPQGWINDPSATPNTICVRAPAGREITGKMYVPSADWKSMVPVTFSIPAAASDDKNRTAFYQAKNRHYNALLAQSLPGAAWFRHQVREADKAIGKEPDKSPRAVARPPDDFADTYSLFSGGRAVSENLQLDRALLPRGNGGDATIPIDTLKGITVKEMDWTPIIKGKLPTIDPLAANIPADQYAVFFPTFASAITLIDEADRQGTPVLQYAEPRSEDARTRQRYERQLCLSMSGMGRLLGPSVIKSVAVTGSDPSLRVGADVAILFEPKDTSASLQNMLSVQMGLMAASAKAPPVNGNAGGVAYTGFVSPDRAVSVYMATIGKAVVVTNSLAELQALAGTQTGVSKSIDTTSEYTFFRDRYRVGEGDEAALLVLTDATIRRWCSPRWRIADSRRTRAAAIMSEVQAAYLNQIATGKIEPGPIHSENGLSEAGEMRLTPSGVTSSIYGSLDFMTPILELELSKVTQGEADTYNRWRDTYQQNWSNYFDPIAIRFSAAVDHLGADLTVMPLIANSEYRDMIQFTRNVKIQPGAGDPHDALLHLAMAFNVQADQVRQASGMASTFVPQLKADPFSWIGQTIAIYVDDDPIWKEAAAAGWKDEFFQKRFGELPIAIYIQSTSTLKLTAFLTGVHAFIDQTVPGMTIWEPQKYNEMFYVKVSPTKQAKKDTKELENVSVYYSTTGGALLITTSESLMKRSLDRQIAATTQPAAPDATKIIPWIGDSFCAQVNAQGMSVMRSMFGRTYSSEMQRRSWGNLPILNEWKRLYPDRDPLQVHEQLWKTRLEDPAGGAYVWNNALGTMESTLYGCPESPKAGPDLPPGLDALRRANFGVSFEGEGMRARAEMYRENRK